MTVGKKETPLARFGKKRAAEDAKRDSWARGLLKRAERAADLPARPSP